MYWINWRINYLFSEMIDLINKFAQKGYYIGVYPIKERSGYQWVGYVMVDGTRLWLQGDDKCSMSAFISPERAYKAAFTEAKKLYDKSTK